MKAKPTKKTPAKKAVAKVPEKKLIDGLYSHKFNCRILPDSGKAMEEMMKAQGLKSFNKAINIALSEHHFLKTKINTLNDTIRDMERNNSRINNVVSNFKVSMLEMQNLEINEQQSRSTREPDDHGQSEIGECDTCGADDEPVYKAHGMTFCKGCLEDAI